MANRTCSAYDKASAADYNFRHKYHYRPADRRCGNCKFCKTEERTYHKCKNPNAFPPDVPEPLRDLFVDQDYVCDLWAR